jgi:hypothetical protein
MILRGEQAGGKRLLAQGGFMGITVGDLSENKWLERLMGRAEKPDKQLREVRDWYLGLLPSERLAVLTMAQRFRHAFAKFGAQSAFLLVFDLYRIYGWKAVESDDGPPEEIFRRDRERFTTKARSTRS